MKPYHLLSINFSADNFTKVGETYICNDYETFVAGAEGEYRIQGSMPYKCAFFYVDAEADDDIVLSISCSLTYKLWINQNFNGISPETNSIMTGMVQKGKNLIVLEFLEPTKNLSLSCRVSFASYETQPYPDRLLYHNLYIEYVRFTLDVKDVVWEPGGEIRFLLALNNRWNIDVQQQVKIQYKPYWQDIILTETEGVPNKECVIKLPDDLNGDAYILSVCYKLLDGTEHTKDFYLYSPKLYTAKDEIMKTIQLFVENPACTGYTKLMFNYLLDLYRKTPTDDTMAQMIRCLEYVNGHGSLDSLIYRHGNIDRFFVSKLDGKTEKYHVSVPKNYDPNKKYALYITVATYRYGQDSDILCQCDNENVVWADISCRGYTLGSYIGEASALEAINDLCTTYNIDRSRIYLSGSSNGGSCAWVLAKSYPHIFAGIKIVSGYVELADLGNLSNMCVLNISSKYEDMYAASFENPQKILEENENYNGYLVEEMNHSDLMKIRFQQDLTMDLLAYSTNLWPEQIQLYSTRYMHDRCYWVKVHQSIETKRTVCIKSRRLDDKTIEVIEENVAAFEIILPNVMDRGGFAIIVNQVRYEFNGYDCPSVFFIKEKERFHVCDEVKGGQSRRGVGLLNVFLHPVQIYCDAENFLTKKVAKAFSSPCGNGYDPHIHIEYPIVDVNTLKNRDNIGHGIVIDSNLSFPLLENIRNKAALYTDVQGFGYQAQRYDGNYVVIQLIKGDLPTNDILYINTNDIKLYQRVLFLRKLILPSYINGFHPYLNNDALIYYNGRYYAIESYGMPLKLIRGENISRSMSSDSVSHSTFSPMAFTFRDKLEFENNWSLCQSADQAAYDYFISDGVFIPLSGKYVYLSDNIIPNDVAYTITATVRAYDRAGVVVDMGSDGKGYAILFLSENGENCMDFINDDCVWGKHPHVNGQAFDYHWGVGEWYKVKLEANVSEDELRAKVWKENENEPPYWMFTAELKRMAAIHRYGAKFIRKGKPGLRFDISDGKCPQFKDIRIVAQEPT